MDLAFAFIGSFSSTQFPAFLCSCLLIGGLTLVERRGKGKPLGPKRQIELKTLLNSIPDLLVIVDTAGRIVDANEAASRLSGLPQKKMIGMSITTFGRRLDGEAASNVLQFNKPIAKRALAGVDVHEERRSLRHPKSGEDIELLISANPICTESGEVVGALIIGRDVSELTKLQKQLADIDRHQAIGHVAAGIAHDFNNTLQTISQAVAVIQMSPDKPVSEEQVFLEMIENAVRRGAEVIGRIRDYLRSGTTVAGLVDVRKVMEEAEELTRPMLRSSSVQVRKEINTCGLVPGNKADLLRMFTNLIVNSVQAMPKGGNILLGCEDQGNTVHAWVRDTGVGITPEVSKRIFDPYFTTKAGGTGLGLSGAQKIMLDLGGNISFHSEPDKETQFDLWFPKEQKQADAEKKLA